MPDFTNPTSSRRAAIAVVLLLAGVCAGLLGASSRATAATAQPRFNGVDVVQVDGLIDPPNASLIRNSIHGAERRDATLLVLQLDSGGAVDVDAVALARVVREARIPIVVWVGPAGASVRGGAALVAEAAARLSLASNAHVGPLLPLRLDRHEASDATRALDVVAPSHRAGVSAAALATRKLSARDAVRFGVADHVDPVLRGLLQSLDGVTVVTAAGPRSLRLLAIDPKTGAPSLNQDLRFRKLSLAGQLQHTLGAPWVAYFLFLTGLALIVFEFFTISIGLAGLVGAVALVGSLYGFSHLPVRLWAVGLLMLAVVGLAIDVQAGGLGPWTVIGTISLVVGSIYLYGGSSRLHPVWWTLVLVCAGVLLFMIGGMTAMLRSRFATPTVGREGMVGELGTAEVAVAPDGVVRIRDALWRARTNRATPITAGATVRVVAVEGLLLEVEPESGGARDYRDRSPKRS